MPRNEQMKNGNGEVRKGIVVFLKKLKMIGPNKRIRLDGLRRMVSQEVLSEACNSGYCGHVRDCDGLRFYVTALGLQFLKTQEKKDDL